MKTRNLALLPPLVSGKYDTPPTNTKKQLLIAEFDRFRVEKTFIPLEVSTLPKGCKLRYVPPGILNGTTFPRNEIDLPATDLINACASLLAVDSNLQHIVHAGINFDLHEIQFGFMKELESTLRALPKRLSAEHRFNTRNSTFYIVEGGEKDSYSAFNFYMVLIEDGIPPETIHFIPSRPDRFSENILLHNGVPYRAQAQLESQIRELFPI